MKRILWWVCLMTAPLAAASATEATEAPAGFSERVSEADYKAAGLDKLTPEERTRLDALVAAEARRLAAAVAKENVATKAAKTDKPAPPPLIRGKIAGTLSGWSEGSVLVFEDGSRWRVLSKGSYRAAPVRKSPKAELFPLGNGNYIMTLDTVPRRVEVRAATETE